MHLKLLSLSFLIRFNYILSEHFKALATHIHQPLTLIFKVVAGSRSRGLRVRGPPWIGLASLPRGRWTRGRCKVCKYIYFNFFFNLFSNFKNPAQRYCAWTATFPIPIYLKSESVISSNTISPIPRRKRSYVLCTQTMPRAGVFSLQPKKTTW